MNRKSQKFLALLLTFVLLLSACGVSKPADTTAPATTEARELWIEVKVPVYDEETWTPTHYDDMEYHRPVLAQLEDANAKAIALAQGDDFEALGEAVLYCDAVYCDISTMYTLAYYHYCQDLNDPYWTEEYEFMENFQLETSASAEELFMALAKSPFREELEDDDVYFPEDFFDDYDGDATWDETYTALKQEEADLVTEYYDIISDADQNANAEDPTYYFATYGNKLAENYVALVAKRQEIARYEEYENYLDYAYEEIFLRDYSPEEAYAYCLNLAQDLQGIYQKVMQKGYGMGDTRSLTPEENLAALEALTNTLGGIFTESFDLMTENKLYDIVPGESRFPGAYCTYLDNYHEPILIITPTGTVRDKLTLTHEFGHFTDAYAGDGLLSGMDVAEVFSQALEYLSLEYGEDMRSLKKMKLADCLDTYLFQSLLAAFEYEVFNLPDEELTAETVTEIFKHLTETFGMPFVPEKFFTQVPHFYESPGYVISYVVSNDLAVQIYEQELEETGAGVALFQEFIGCNAEHIVELAEEMGLESPFAEDRLEKVKSLMVKQVLN